jgi:hypothetical protein
LLTFFTTLCTGGLLSPSYVAVTIEGDVARMLAPAETGTPVAAGAGDGATPR